HLVADELEVFGREHGRATIRARHDRVPRRVCAGQARELLLELADLAKQLAPHGAFVDRDLRQVDGRQEAPVGRRANLLDRTHWQSLPLSYSAGQVWLPSFMKVETAWARFDALSLRRMLLTWVFTVPS